MQSLSPYPFTHRPAFLFLTEWRTDFSLSFIFLSLFLLMKKKFISFSLCLKKRMSAKMRTEYADKNADKTALKETKTQTIRKNIYNFLICKNFLNARTCAMEKEQKNKKCQFHLHQLNKKFTNKEKYHKNKKLHLARFK